MKHPHPAPSVTSLPLSPQVESDHRVRKYMITMVIRTTCFVLMAVVQPYGWWTWLFAAAAIFLPYVAVVDANAGMDSVETKAESPLQQLESTAPEAPAAPETITIRESERTWIASSGDDGAAPSGDGSAPSDDAAEADER